MTAQKLLVVDDEIDVALSFKLILEKHGFSVDLFHKPLAALVSFKHGSV
jgi:DNA-binding response OmpR family regulator